MDNFSTYFQLLIATQCDLHNKLQEHQFNLYYQNVFGNQTAYQTKRVFPLRHFLLFSTYTIKSVNHLFVTTISVTWVINKRTNI